MKNDITANVFHTQDDLCPMAKAWKVSRYGSSDVRVFCWLSEAYSKYPVGNYMFKVNNRNTRTR